MVRERLADRYRLVSVVGSGGMGTVWRAYDETLDREVAVKELHLPDELTETERAEACSRAVREAQAAARLQHPGIIVVHDAFIAEGRPWIVMQLLQGESLDVVLKTRGRLTPQHAAQIGLQVVDALQVAHAAGIVHRDIKTGNVFITASGDAILTDFGIATVAGQATITRSGMLVGSPGHIAPELLRGQRAGPQSDMWSLAAMLYQAVEGVPPHDGDTHVIVLTKVLTEDPRPPVLAGELAPLLLNMLAKDPAARPEIPVVRDMLDRLSHGHQATPLPLPLPAAPVTPVRPSAPTTIDMRYPTKPSKINALAWAAGAVVVLLAGTATAAVATDGFASTATPKASSVAKPVRHTPGPTAQPSGTPAKFTTPLDFCTLLSLDQVHQIIPQFKGAKGTPGGNLNAPTCAWDAPGQGVQIGLLVDYGKNPWQLSPGDAHDSFTAGLHYKANGSSKIIWHYGNIGGESITSGPETKAENVPNLGEEAYVVDIYGRLGAQMTEVFFRISNITFEITHADVTGTTGGARIRQNAVQFAHWAADNLSKRG